MSVQMQRAPPQRGPSTWNEGIRRSPLRAYDQRHEPGRYFGRSEPGWHWKPATCTFDGQRTRAPYPRSRPASATASSSSPGPNAAEADVVTVILPLASVWISSTYCVIVGTRRFATSPAVRRHGSRTGLVDLGNRRTALARRQNRFRNPRPDRVVLVRRQRDRRQNADDRDDDHQFDQRKALLNSFHCPSPWLFGRPEPEHPAMLPTAEQSMCQCHRFRRGA